MAPQTNRYSIPGIVTQADVEKAETRLEQIQDKHQEAIARRSEISRIVHSNTKSIRAYGCLLRFRKFGDDWMTRTGFLFPLVLVGSIVLLPLVTALIAATSALISNRALFLANSVVLLGSVLVALTFAFRQMLFIPDDGHLQSRIEEMQSDLRRLASEQERVEAEIEHVTLSLERVDATYRQTLRAFQSRINLLRQSHWETMQGIEFENFLAEVFLESGYQVETTKVTGDQGVDLIVCRGARRIAIQAKGYPGSTVGNSAVQEARTGMLYYDCHVCAVVTNSTFTSGARDLASKVGCLLLDRSSIPSLIEGQVTL
jgi:HJR/Mrr/RecB family endonuclease